MKNRSLYAQRVTRLTAQLFSGVLLVAVTLMLTSCAQVVYKDPQYNFAGRPTPPSNLLNRVMASYTANGSQGGLEILDSLRDLRRNVQNTIPFFSIAGYAGAQPTQILNFPEQLHGFVLNASDGSVALVDYSKETGAGTLASFGSFPPSVAAAPDGSVVMGAAETSGVLGVAAGGGTFVFSLPNVYRVAVNQGGSVLLAMVRNSNTLYRIIRLPSTINPVIPPGSIDCQPLLLPQLCLVPVAGAYDRPIGASFSLDGAAVYIENCGPECGGTAASVTVLQEGALVSSNVPTVNPLTQPPPYLPLPVANPISVPGGVTALLSDGNNLYASGQSLFSLTGGVLNTTPRADGLYTGFLTTISLSTYKASNPVSISDGTHTKMLFADDNTLWVGSQQCANGERAAQGLNINCLTMVQLGAATPTATVVPLNVVPGGAVTVPYPNGNFNPYYYGSLTGVCWPQNLHKVYAAYGGQIHGFFTGGTITDTREPGYGTTPIAGTELDNTNITVQGTVLDVAYMDAMTNSAN